MMSQIRKLTKSSKYQGFSLLPLRSSLAWPLQGVLRTGLVLTGWSGGDLLKPEWAPRREERNGLGIEREPQRRAGAGT